MSPEPMDPDKYHIIGPKQIRPFLLIVLLMLLLLVPPVAWSYYKFAVFRPSQTAKEVTFEIKQGESLTEIASRLGDTEAINSDFLFMVYVLANKLDKSIQAGIYTIPAGSNIVDVAAKFQHGVNDIDITFIEGWRVEEYARAAVQKYNKIDYKEFLMLALKKEGYLFPDTYSFNKDVNEREMIEALENNFNKKTKEIVTQENLQGAGLTKEQAVIFASIVEREMRDADDRPKIAGILIKRWRNGMKLDADATTQYAVVLDRICPSPEDFEERVINSFCSYYVEPSELLEIDWWPKGLTQDEIDVENPYNTRKVLGLPPAPISSFSQSSLEAVVNYEETEYWYYLTDDRGVTHYAETLEEHNQNIVKFL